MKPPVGWDLCVSSTLFGQGPLPEWHHLRVTAGVCDPTNGESAGRFPTTRVLCQTGGSHRELMTGPPAHHPLCSAAGRPLGILPFCRRGLASSHQLSVWSQLVEWFLQSSCWGLENFGRVVYLKDALNT